MRARALFVVSVLLFFLSLRAFADDLDPTRLIGLDLKSAVDTLGLPQDMFSFRGEVDTSDNVVFYYRNYIYLFWYKDRVWQVRCDRRFSSPVFGFTLGMTREQVQQASGRQLMPLGDSLYFDVEDASYPLRVRLVFAQNVLADLYVYRSDF
jgi:hypothetical protein